DINIQINCNLNAENVDSIPELIQQLKVQNITYPLIFSDVIDTKDEQYEYTLKEDTHWYEVHKIALEEGYTYEPFYRDIFLGCSMFQKNNFIIGANGYLYSCIEAVGLKQFQQVHVREYGEFMFDFIRSQEINKNESLE
ncbi:radical SAM/SPASM domain-containing protein, partial [Enterococcus faecalis]